MPQLPGQASVPRALQEHRDRIRALEAAGVGGAEYQIKVFLDRLTLLTGNDKIIFLIPESLDGLNLLDAQGYITTVSSSGVVTVRLRNITQGVNMLSTAITIDVGEFSSYTAAAPPVVDPLASEVATADRIAVDVDVAGTGAKGLGVIVTFL
jgi:hypothetical protein